MRMVCVCARVPSGTFAKEEGEEGQLQEQQAEGVQQRKRDSLHRGGAGVEEVPQRHALAE